MSTAVIDSPARELGSVAPPPKAVKAFYTPSGAKGKTVLLFVTRGRSAKAPVFDGRVGAQHMSFFVRQDGTKTYLSISDDRKADGTSETLGSARVVVNSRGRIKLAINLTGASTLWAELSGGVPQDVLVKAGLRLDDLEAKQAAHRAHQLATA